MKKIFYSILMVLALFLVACSPTTSSSTTDTTSTTTNNDDQSQQNQDNQQAQGNDDNNQTNNNENQTNENEEVKLIDYKFKVFELPHDSEGLTVVARIKLNKKYYRENVGKITNYTPETCIEGTVKLPSKYDEFSLWLVDNNDGKDEAKYYLSVNKKAFYNENTDVYEIDGYYYIYYENNSFVKNYVGINEVHFKKLELDKEYSFDYKKQPFLLFYLDNMKGKAIAVQVQENKSITLDENGNEKETKNTYTDVYYSSDIKKLMSYDVSYSEMLSKRGEEIQSDRIYFMVKPMYYDSSDDKSKTEAKVTFTRVIQDTEKCLTIDKSVFASDNYLYASGKYLNEKTLTKLYKIDPKTNERVFFHEFGGEITAICEPTPGTLLVSYSIKDEQEQESTSISKIVLATETVSDLVDGIEKLAEYMVGYKDNKVVLFAKDFHTTARFAFLIDYAAGVYKPLTEKCLFSLKQIKEGFYIPEYDIIIYSVAGSPKDFSFLKIDETDLENPSCYGWDTKYHVEYEMHYPIKMVKTDPLEVMTADGDIFKIDIDFIDSVEPIDDYDNPSVGNYYTRIQDWCNWNRTVDIACTDFFIKDNYFYIVRLENDEESEYSNIYRNTFVEKYSFDAPDTIIESCKFTHEDGMKFWSDEETLYLQTTYWDYLSDGTSSSMHCDMICFHEIDF